MGRAGKMAQASVRKTLRNLCEDKVNVYRKAEYYEQAEARVPCIKCETEYKTVVGRQINVARCRGAGKCFFKECAAHGIVLSRLPSRGDTWSK